MIRITFSRKRLYDSDQVNTKLYLFEHLYEGLINLHSAEKIQQMKKELKDENRDTCAYLNGLCYSTMFQAKRDGLKDIKHGGELCQRVESLIKENFPEKYNEWLSENSELLKMI